MDRIYFDHAATTPVSKNVLEKMLPYFNENFGNSHSQHSFGRNAVKGVDIARSQVAKALNCLPNEIYFTGSGTEADNWAIKGSAWARQSRGKHIITSQIEHPAVLNSCKWLEKQGFEVTYLPVDGEGFVKLDELEKALRKDTILVSIMFANNEVGAIQPVRKIAEIVKKNSDALFHVDAVQAVGAVKVDVKEIGCDMLTVSAHKFYGPKGIGALFIRNGLKIDKLIIGGGQERAMRGGTSNTPAIVGMGQAIEDAVNNLESYSEHCKKLRDRFISRVESEVPYVKLNGPRENRLPNNANFSFEFIEGESILYRLDLAGIAVSSGSACSSGSLEPSHVLLAMGVDIVMGHGSIRFSFGKDNTMEQVDYAVDKIKEVVSTLRQMSPLFNLKEGDVSNV